MNYKSLDRFELINLLRAECPSFPVLRLELMTDDDLRDELGANDQFNGYRASGKSFEEWFKCTEN